LAEKDDPLTRPILPTDQISERPLMDTALLVEKHPSEGFEPGGETLR
jgi:hypothetical protein